MSSVLSSEACWIFALVVGVGGAVCLLLWCLLTRIMGVVIMDWGLMGRWALGLFRGYSNVCSYCRVLKSRGQPDMRDRFAVSLSCQGRSCGFMSRYTAVEHVLGVAILFGFSCFYALLLLLLCGAGYMAHPRLLPVLVVSFALSALVGQVVMAPMMGVGIFSRHHYNPRLAMAMVMAGHAIFAMGQYETAITLAC